MSGNKRVVVVMIICGAALAAAALFAVGSIFNVMGDTYENAVEYSQGDADISESVKNLDIRWPSGKVNVASHSGKSILLRETSERPISSDLEMRWWLDGDTLRVQYAKSGFRFWFGFLRPEKELTVTLPEDMSLDDVGISTTSADMEIPSLKAETVSLKATSGDIDASFEAATAGVGATSGDVICRIGDHADELSVETTSGEITVEAEDVDDVRIKSTSGDIDVTGDRLNTLDAGSTSGKSQFSIKECGDTKISSTSGNIRIELSTLESLKINATSGDVTAVLPEKPGFTADLHATSGDVKTSLAMTSQGSTYVCGDGSKDVQIHTTSGDIVID